MFYKKCHTFGLNKKNVGFVHYRTDPAHLVQFWVFYLLFIKKNIMEIIVGIIVPIVIGGIVLVSYLTHKEG